VSYWSNFPSFLFFNGLGWNPWCLSGHRRSEGCFRLTFFGVPRFCFWSALLKVSDFSLPDHIVPWRGFAGTPRDLASFRSSPRRPTTDSSPFVLPPGRFVILRTLHSARFPNARPSFTTGDRSPGRLLDSLPLPLVRFFFRLVPAPLVERQRFLFARFPQFFLHH